MIVRNLQDRLTEYASQMPVVAVTGPRQSGKTTLCRMAFPGRRYVSLEPLDTREYARTDPRGFLREYGDGVILDEVQRAPDLFSYIQTLVDREDTPGRYVLSGSQNFLLLRSISQSLAGRSAILHLLPLSLDELEEREPFPLEKLVASIDVPASHQGKDRPATKKLSSEPSARFFVTRPPLSAIQMFSRFAPSSSRPSRWTDPGSRSRSTPSTRRTPTGTGCTRRRCAC